MKRSLLSILSLLTVALAAVAQPRISSNKETHNFGQIEWKRPVTVEYTITNTGNQPLVLTNVTTSCACAVADWTKEPFAGFIFMLGITMIAAPGVPGGAIMASLGILQSMLGFDESAQALMIALYIAMDSFGTACNVTGDGAIALIIDKIMGKNRAERLC